MSACPSKPFDADILLTFPAKLVSIGFDPAPRPVWPVQAQSPALPRMAMLSRSRLHLPNAKTPSHGMGSH
jgi:hypothetical protein